MEGLSPISFYNIILLSIFFQFLNFMLIQMCLDEVAEIRNKKNLSCSIPKEWMFFDLIKQMIVSMPYSFSFVKYKIQELNVLFINKVGTFQFARYKRLSVHENQMKHSSYVCSYKARDIFRTSIIFLFPTSVGHFSKQTRNSIDFEFKTSRFSLFSKLYLN